MGRHPGGGDGGGGGGGGNNFNNCGNNSNLDSRMLWATLTPRGTRHHIVATDPVPYYAQGIAGAAAAAGNEDHYEVVDYYRHENKMNAQNTSMGLGRNNGTTIAANYLRNVAPLKVKVCGVVRDYHGYDTNE